jgi:hypothetical protein
MSRRTSGKAVPIPAEQVDYLIATAARAPSVHNTQPWRFKVSRYAIELYADPRRKLRVDRLGREMLISCGAAVFGLRLAVRSLGYLPLVELLPDPDRLRLLARVRLGAAEHARAGRAVSPRQDEAFRSQVRETASASPAAKQTSWRSSPSLASARMDDLGAKAPPQPLPSMSKYSALYG